MLQEYRFSKDWPYHISCGGVVYRYEADQLRVLAVVEHGGGYDLPKGTLHRHETLEQCALREVEEETGQTARIVGYLGGELFEGTEPESGLNLSKTTHYFAMKWVSDAGAHDEEYHHAEWLDVETALRVLGPKKGRIVKRLIAFLGQARSDVKV